MRQIKKVPDRRSRGATQIKDVVRSKATTSCLIVWNKIVINTTVALLNMQNNETRVQAYRATETR